eukprot:gene21325-8103_t
MPRLASRTPTPTIVNVLTSSTVTSRSNLVSDTWCQHGLWDLGSLKTRLDIKSLKPRRHNLSNISAMVRFLCV